jgi:hypothetical protein
VACTETEGCGGDYPFCFIDETLGPSFCAECISTADCAPEVEFCDTGECWNRATLSLRAIRAGTGSWLHRATVTYVQPAVGSDPAGFFLQGELLGPAVFVAVDPSLLAPSPTTGDRVTFQVLGSATVARQFRITSLSDWTVVSSGNPVAPLRQDVSSLSDLVSNLDGYESEFVRISGILGTFGPAGVGYVAAQLHTVGLSSPDLQLRLPQTVEAALDAGGCLVTLEGVPMWRSSSIAQPSALQGADFSSIICPPPRATGATAPSNAQVVVTFDRAIESTTVTPAAFAIDPALDILAVAATARQVYVTTGPQVPGTTYAITVAGSVQGLHGAGVETPNASTFVGAP